MDSRTPIRLTPHRGPLATPSTSPESSPTSSTPPNDAFCCPTAIQPALDVALLQHRFPALSPPMGHQPRTRLFLWAREVAEQRIFSHSAYSYPHLMVLGSIIYSTLEIAKALAGIVTLCLMIWGLLEFSTYTSKLPQQPNLWISNSQFPLPSPTRALRCHANPSICGSRDQHDAVLHFLSEQIGHAKALSSLSGNLGLPLHTFLEFHRSTLAVGRNLPKLSHLVKQVDAMENSTELLSSSILDFAPGSFIGRSFTLGLDELDDLISKTAISFPYEKHQDARLHAIYWRTASNLLLEYSAARARARKLLQHIRALHQQLSPLISAAYAAESIERRTNVWWWKGTVRHPTASIGDRMQALVAGLEITLDNLHRLTAYLDWITEHLARTTLRDALKTRQRTDFLSTFTALQELFTQSKPSRLTPKKHCFCRVDCGIMPPTRLERVDIIVPGSPTVQARR